MQSKTYPLPDPVALTAKIISEGGPSIDPRMPTGKVVAHHVQLGWSIADGKITVSLLSKPYYITEDMVWGPLDKLFTEAA